ncbi:GAF domain-containing protein [Altibacter sp.]|uniref:GAF domain-containing protein n=1 Tax=Altibacter sp. TaxID=2024823 RepID=UPI000C8BC90B|nr:GAF domain-containing protein [Altibacter sp.]MAP55544.1 GAF domain-containing protein [Altibacter sp.]|tara:strand:- start:110 stop:2482 length:2373 start_codon:yes stop_codon:yes gene_type:complete
MKAKQEAFPLHIKISFKKLFDHYRSVLESDSKFGKDRAREVLKLEKEYPELSEGFDEEADLAGYTEQIDFLLADIFNEALTLNEIKVATTPFQTVVFKATQRYKNILKQAGKDFTPELVNFDEKYFYIMGCSIILNAYYGYKIDFKRPFYYNIPDAGGTVRNYRVIYNGDFMDVEKTDKAVEITQEDVDELMENFENIEIWKEKFPEEGWIFKGFVIANLFDVTTDVSISDFKSHLLRHESEAGDLGKDMETIFRTIFNLKDLKMGFSDFNEEDGTFERILYKNVNSYILDDKDSEVCSDALCDASFYTLFKKHELYCVTNTQKYHTLYPNNVLYKKLLDQNIKSALFAAIVDEGKVLGVLELVSPTVNGLNTINANKLKDVMPFLIDSVVRSKEQAENELELVIQEECTSIHSSVHWKFKREAKRYLSSLAKGEPSYFREIVFNDVYPLYGQIDVKGSSTARNDATKKDLVLQLNHVQKIIEKIHAIEKLPIYEHIAFRINKYLEDLNEELQVDSERQVLTFLRKEIIPLFTHLSKKSETLKELIQKYQDLIDTATGLIYKHRKDYDDSVMLINKRMASILDKKQIEAQQMYPHYFERFKTDGVEHNLYIGEAITKTKSFNKVYLYNLRLWQLQVMCEMENNYYKLKERLPVAMDVASMILSFNSSLSLRFRMDEKRFDVDGTYNARYEVVKKRVDKAFIKGTEERITQAGKITIVYSQKEDEEEYLKYISFLQDQKKLDTDVEILELEDLQGVTGLKAIRVSVLYVNETSDQQKEYYTYDDLMSQISS